MDLEKEKDGEKTVGAHVSTLAEIPDRGCHEWDANLASRRWHHDNDKDT
jgi:hypothetical protein